MPRIAPRLTFSALIKLMAPKSPAAMLTILREQKEVSRGPIMSYREVEHRITAHLVDGVPLPLTGDLRPYELEALQAFAAAKDVLPAGATYTRPAPNLPKLDLYDVAVSCVPTAFYTLPAGQRGALKLYLNKEPRLGPLGKKMATLVWYHLNALGTGGEKEMIQVIDVRGRKAHEAGAHVQLLKQLEATCLLVKSLWDRV